MTYSVGLAISTGPHCQQHGIANTSPLFLCTGLPLLLAQQVLSASPELLLADAARLPHELFKQGIQISAQGVHAIHSNAHELQLSRGQLHAHSLLAMCHVD